VTQTQGPKKLSSSMDTEKGERRKVGQKVSRFQTRITTSILRRAFAEKFVNELSPGAGEKKNSASRIKWRALQTGHEHHATRRTTTESARQPETIISQACSVRGIGSGRFIVTKLQMRKRACRNPTALALRGSFRPRNRWRPCSRTGSRSLMMTYHELMNALRPHVVQTGLV
jgi:hypothetical protein